MKTEGREGGREEVRREEGGRKKRRMTVLSLPFQFNSTSYRGCLKRELMIEHTHYKTVHRRLTGKVKGVLGVGRGVMGEGTDTLLISSCGV